MGEGYWKELDKDGNLIRICQIDDSGNYDGMCYIYNCNKIRRVSKWENGKEVKVLKQFNGDIMTEYRNGRCIYKGGYENSVKLCFPRNGKGEEFDKDGITKIFQGHYKNGKRHGAGAKYKKGIANNNEEWIIGHNAAGVWCIQSLILIIALFLICISFIVRPIIGAIILALLLLFLLIQWRYHKWLGEKLSLVFGLDFVVERIIEKSNTHKSKKKGCCIKILENKYLCMFIILVIIIMIFTVYSIVDYYYGGPNGIGYFQENYSVQNGYGDHLLRFTLSGHPNLKTIDIGDSCFINVQRFKIDGLNGLKSLTIGVNSFTEKKKNYGNNESKSFRILNCESLESIEIGEYSFSDFGGEFELKNLPSLQSIQIGKIGSKSYNFCCSSFVIRGILNDIEDVMIRFS